MAFVLRKLDLYKWDSPILAASAGNTIPHSRINVSQAYLFRIPASKKKSFRQSRKLAPGKEKSSYKTKSLNLYWNLVKYPHMQLKMSLSVIYISRERLVKSWKTHLEVFPPHFLPADFWSRQQEKGTAEDEMVGWHYPLNGHEFG